MHSIALGHRTASSETLRRFERSGRRIQEAVRLEIESAEARLGMSATSTLVRLAQQNPDALDPLENDIPVARRVFLLDRVGRPIRPPTSIPSLGNREDDVEPSRSRRPISPVLDETSWRALRRAERSLHVDNSPREAYEILETALVQCPPEDRPPLQSMAADCLARIGDLDAALELYGEILNVSPKTRAPEGIPYFFFAHRNSIQLELERKNPEAAAGHLVALAREVSVDRFGLPAGVLDHFSRVVQDQTEGVVLDFMRRGEVESSQSLRRALRDIDELREFVRRLRDPLHAQFLEILSRNEPVAASTSGTEKERFEYLVHDRESEPRVYGLICISDPSGERRGLLGFELDLPYLNKLVTPLCEQIAREQDARIDWSAGELPPSPESASSSAIALALRPPLDFQKFRIEARDPKAALKQRLLQTTLLFALVLCMLGAIVFGGLVIVRSTTRELELARLKSDFVSTVSHELKSPVTSILLFGENLKKKETSEEKRIKYATFIVRESQRLSRMIEEILDLARLEAGGRPLTLEPVDLPSIVGEAVDFIRPRALKEGYRITYRQTQDLPLGLADRDAVSQILLNLLENAIVHSQGEKQIRVSVARAGNRWIAVDVQDAGTGIPPGVRSRLFERFAAGRRGGGGHRGAGLGLSIARALARAQKGDLVLVPTEGRGSRFVLSIPVAREKSQNRQTL